MGCCKEVPNNRIMEFEDLPDVTFLCMARMAYTLASVAEFFYTGRERVSWINLPDGDCAQYATKVKLALRGVPISEDPYDQLFARMLRSVTLHV